MCYFVMAMGTLMMLSCTMISNSLITIVKSILYYFKSFLLKKRSLLNMVLYELVLFYPFLKFMQSL